MKSAVERPPSLTYSSIWSVVGGIASRIGISYSLQPRITAGKGSCNDIIPKLCEWPGVERERAVYMGIAHSSEETCEDDTASSAVEQTRTRFARTFPLTEARLRFERAARRALAQEMQSYASAGESLHGITRDEALRHIRFRKRSESAHQSRAEIYAINMLMRQRELRRFEDYVSAHWWRRARLDKAEATSEPLGVAMQIETRRPFARYEAAMDSAQVEYERSTKCLRSTSLTLRAAVDRVHEKQLEDTSEARGESGVRTSRTGVTQSSSPGNETGGDIARQPSLSEGPGKARCLPTPSLAAAPGLPIASTQLATNRTSSSITTIPSVPSTPSTPSTQTGPSAVSTPTATNLAGGSTARRQAAPGARPKWLPLQQLKPVVSERPIGPVTSARFAMPFASTFRSWSAFARSGDERAATAKPILQIAPCREGEGCLEQSSTLRGQEAELGLEPSIASYGRAPIRDSLTEQSPPPVPTFAEVIEVARAAAHARRREREAGGDVSAAADEDISLVANEHAWQDVPWWSHLVQWQQRASIVDT